MEILEDKLLREDIENAVAGEYRGLVEVKHILEVFGIEEIKARIRDLTIKPLSELKVASYYGCLLSRPSDVNIFRNPENPEIMDDVIEDIGGVAIDWDYKTECCGANFTIAKPEIVEKLTYRILSSAVESGADAVVVACPFCQLNLDLRQRDVNRSFDEEFNIPVLYITQFIGLALGLSEGELGLDKLMTDPTSVLERI
jgi:heterodisulfide reductase subunit B